MPINQRGVHFASANGGSHTNTALECANKLPLMVIYVQKCIFIDFRIVNSAYVVILALCA